MTGDASRSVDDRNRIASIDPEGMLTLIEELPRQWREATELARAADLSRLEALRSKRPRQVVLLGMGGSAIGGDMMRSLLEPTSPAPIFVNRDYTLPAFVDGDTLVIASSYSGNTEETLSACERAQARGAALAAITSGGRLQEMARAHGWPTVTIPGGMSPRAAIGYSLAPLMVMMERVGLATQVSGALQETGEVLDALRAEIGVDVPFNRNPAKQLAHSICRVLPVVYGSQGWKGVAAYRWKCQFNENSKWPAVHNTFPELNHNETVGFEAADELLRAMWVIFLRDRHDDPRIAARVDVTKEMVAEKAAGVTEVWARGESDLARLLSLSYFGDFVSLYHALLREVDPTPIASIDYLKSRLADL